MGTGKTAAGKILEAKMDIEELDERFVTQKGMSISQFFDTYGESAFRDEETKLLKQADLPVVITGGGIINRLENRQWMKANGTVVWIDTPFDVLWERIRDDSRRPLVSSKEETESLFRQRENLYRETADVVLDGRLSPQYLAKQIERLAEGNQFGLD
nr:shikimate kinase [Exiguobacterium flavidum]